MKGWWGGLHSNFYVQPPTTVKVRLSLSWGCDNKGWGVCGGRGLGGFV